MWLKQGKMAVPQYPYGWWATQHLEKSDKIIVNSRKIKESNDTKIREKGVEVITEIQQPTLLSRSLLAMQVPLCSTHPTCSLLSSLMLTSLRLQIQGPLLI